MHKHRTDIYSSCTMTKHHRQEFHGFRRENVYADGCLSGNQAVYDKADKGVHYRGDRILKLSFTPPTEHTLVKPEIATLRDPNPKPFYHTCIALTTYNNKKNTLK